MLLLSQAWLFASKWEILHSESESVIWGELVGSEGMCGRGKCVSELRKPMSSQPFSSMQFWASLSGACRHMPGEVT